MAVPKIYPVWSVCSHSVFGLSPLSTVTCAMNAARNTESRWRHAFSLKILRFAWCLWHWRRNPQRFHFFLILAKIFWITKTKQNKAKTEENKNSSVSEIRKWILSDYKFCLLVLSTQSMYYSVFVRVCFQRMPQWSNFMAHNFSALSEMWLRHQKPFFSLFFKCYIIKELYDLFRYFFFFWG